MRVLLVSTYDLGRQPFGLASPTAWFRGAGADVECVDTSRDRLQDDHIRNADLVAFYLPMHTATRLAAPLLDRVRMINPRAVLAAYGLYAPLNRAWLRERGVQHVIGPEAEVELVALVKSQSPNPKPETQIQKPKAQSPMPRLKFIQPDRTTLPSLDRYAALQMPDGSRKVVGSTEASRGCKHLCRHCPIVPVYRGVFRAIPLDVVMQDVRSLVEAGAEHISFGDPDFFNGPTHARRLVEQVAHEFPRLTYDVTIKIEHLLKHRNLVPLLRVTGCLFITSAVESVDDLVLDRLRKGHSRADFVQAVDVCRQAGVALSPTFVPFTPWTTVDGYADLLNQIERLGLVQAVAPIQLAIRLLVTAESMLLELPDVQGIVAPFDPQSLAWPWRHADPRVDALHTQVARVVGSMSGASRTDVFKAISALAGVRPGVNPYESQRVTGADPGSDPLTPPYLTEAWYCCAEPGPEQFDLV